MEGQHGHIHRFAVGPAYPSKSLTMCYFDFVFRKYKQDCAFRVSGVLQLAKTGPPVTKNFPLLRLFPSDAMMGWRLYTPYDVNRTNLHILTACGMSHILTRIGQLWRDRNIILRAGQELKSENYESVQHRPQFSEIKRGLKFHFIGTLNYYWIINFFIQNIFKLLKEKMSWFFFCSPKMTQPCPQVFLVSRSITCSGLHFWHHWFNMTKYFSNLVNSSWLWWIVCGFNQSEMGKCFE